MRKRLTLRSVQSRGHSGFAKVMTIVALMLIAVTGAWARTCKVSVKQDTEDAENWTTDPATAMDTGVTQGTGVTVKYEGWKLVKSVKATNTN